VIVAITVADLALHYRSILLLDSRFTENLWPAMHPMTLARRALLATPLPPLSLAIAVVLDVKDIPQVGPLQWGSISTAQ